MFIYKKNIIVANINAHSLIHLTVHLQAMNDIKNNPQIITTITCLYRLTLPQCNEHPLYDEYYLIMHRAANEIHSRTVSLLENYMHWLSFEWFFTTKIELFYIVRDRQCASK